MSGYEILHPALALVALTILSWLRMYHVRLGTMLREKIDPEDMTVFNRKLPPVIVASGDNLRNLFEMPVLFYLAIVLLYVTGSVDVGYLYLAWIYVGLRAVHSVIHTTYNRIKHRFIVHIVSCFVLFAIWVKLAYELLTAGS